MQSQRLDLTNRRGTLTNCGLGPVCFLMAGLILLGLSESAQARPQDSNPLDFNRDIRPILAENCFFCHGQDAKTREADLRLDDRSAAVAAGAVSPGEPDDSELVTRILSDDLDEVMPPPSSARTLTSEQREMLVRWIAEGAAYAEHWAFETPQRPTVPEVPDDNWSRNSIDRFVLDKLQQAGKRPSPEADRRTLVKRLFADLIGLPPTAEEIREFLDDDGPQAYENLVERLFNRPEYGERMALPWLDAARYADSNGFQQDGDHWQWIWRDWVVRALNDDLPFDQFSIWQLAGDLLPDATQDQKIASAFNRNHLLNGEGGAIAEEQRFVNLFDRMDTTATNWLGLTMACAQCHDHKYDPITQVDYYRLMNGFNRVPESGTPNFFSSRIRVDTPFLELPTPENLAHIAELDSRIEAARIPAEQAADLAFAAWKIGLLTNPPLDDAEKLPAEVTSILKIPHQERNEEQNQQLETELRKWFNQRIAAGVLKSSEAWQKHERLKKELADYRADRIPRLMVMSDERPRETHVLDRGQYLVKLEKVDFGTPEFLPPLSAELPKNRLGFAQWLFTDEHPLTARVQVNRLWQHFFGVGLVKTSEDFGVQSEYPLHRELLDWLAVEFRENGWSMKELNRLIVTSATYRQTSRASTEDYLNDPENRWLARGSRFRMPAMVLRDWALASGGILDQRMGGAPVYPYQPQGIWESLAITKERDFTYPESTGADLYRRSLYTFWRRTVGPANMFDSSNRQACRVRSTVTSTPLHALTMLNDPTWVEAARALAERSYQSAESVEGRIGFAFEQVLCRPPNDRELEILVEAFRTQLEIFAEDSDAVSAFLSIGAVSKDQAIDLIELAAFSHVCLAILNLDEAMVRE
jgi:hypothetical protein